MCARADYQIIPQGRWQREWALHHLLRALDKTYHTIYAASIDNPNVQYPVSHLRFARLETFDDGMANLYPDSILYRNPPQSWKRKIINHLNGIRYQTEDLRRLSARHYTLYPQQANIVSPTVPLNIWQKQPENTHSGCFHIHKILLGQPLFSERDDNIALFQCLVQHIQPNAYFPHPREDYRLDNVAYVETHLIFEDYLLQHIQKQPETEFHIYHLVSTAAINVHTFPHTMIHAFRPNDARFEQANFVRLYDLMHKMGITIHPVL